VESFVKENLDVINVGAASAPRTNRSDEARANRRAAVAALMQLGASNG
jgi:hypothetical protein